MAEAAGLIRNAPTAAEATPGALPMLSPGAWEGNEWGHLGAAHTRKEDELRHVPESSASGDNVAFLPLDEHACRVRWTK